MIDTVHSDHDLDLLIVEIDTSIKEVRPKLKNGRVRNPENYKAMLQGYRTLGYLIHTRLKVGEACDLDVHAGRIAELEATTLDSTTVSISPDREPTPAELRAELEHTDRSH